MNPANTRPEPDSPSSKVLIVDDHPVLRRGLAAMIDAEPDLMLCGQAAGCNEALELLDQQSPHLVIIDLMLEDGTGLDLLKTIKSQDPALPVLVLSMHDEAIFAERCLKAGALGYVTKQQLDATLLLAIRCALAGEIYMSDSLKAQLAQQYLAGVAAKSDSPLTELSDRELQVFGLIGHGRTTREIAGILKLSIKTVESHVAHIKQKLQLSSAPALARHAVQWVETGKIH